MYIWTVSRSDLGPASVGFAVAELALEDRPVSVCHSTPPRDRILPGREREFFSLTSTFLARPVISSSLPQSGGVGSDTAA